MEKNKMRRRAAVVGGAAIGGLFFVGPHAASASAYNAAALLFPGEPDGSDTVYSSAQAMNSSGEVVGWAYADVGGNEVQNAFAFPASGPIQNIGALGDQGNDSAAMDVNDSGQVTGQYSVDTIDHAFSYNSTTHAITDISVIDSGTTGVDPGTASVGQFINASGQIVFQQGNSEYQYQPGSTPAVANMGSLGGGVTFAYAMNNAGQVAGYSNTAGATQHAMLYYPGVGSSPGTMVDLTPGDSDISTAYGENEPTGTNTSGVIVGVRDQTTTPMDFYYQDIAGPGTGTATNLSLGGMSASNAIMVNASGKIAGTSYLADETTYHAFYYDTAVGGSPTDLGSLSGPTGYSMAAAISSSGAVVGDSTTAAGDYDAFIWKSGVMTDLGNLGGGYSNATAVNASDEVVGDSYTADYQDDAFVWTAADGMEDLNSLLPAGFFTSVDDETDATWYLTAADEVNDAGDIVATATDGEGDQFDVLLTPVPEPGTASLLMLGAAGLLLRRRRELSR